MRHGRNHLPGLGRSPFFLLQSTNLVSIENALEHFEELERDLTEREEAEKRNENVDGVTGSNVKASGACDNVKVQWDQLLRESGQRVVL